MASEVTVTAATTGPAQLVEDMVLSDVAKVEMDLAKSVLYIEQRNPFARREFDLKLLDTFSVTIASGVATITIENA